MKEAKISNNKTVCSNCQTKYNQTKNSPIIFFGKKTYNLCSDKCLIKYTAILKRISKITILQKRRKHGKKHA